MTSKVKVNTVETESGSTLTLGKSGDTVTLASGASQSGFGRTGTVDWQTTKKTASFTAVNGEGYFIDTSSSAITMTLPASPSAGDIVAFKDYTGTFSTNNLTLGRNGSNLDGFAGNRVINVNNTSMTLVYVDATQGWKSVEEGTGHVGEVFITATGGTVTTCGNFKIHTFTGPGSFSVSAIAGNPSNNSVDYLVIGGGGNAGGDYGGGGGAGGYRFSDGTATGCYSAGPAPLGASALPVSVQSYPITIGAGGTGSGPNTAGNPGSNSSFSTITSAGGGRGGTEATDNSAESGGSGGGAIYGQCGAAGNTPPVTPSQGNPGGDGGSAPGYAGGGGGGASAAGQNSPGSNAAGNGGDGLASSITGSAVTRGGGGGGGGGGNPHSQPYTAGTGGSGGGGAGVPSSCTSNPGGDGTANTGGGGGGAALSGPSVGGSGGSGIVIIRYKYQ